MFKMGVFFDLILGVVNLVNLVMGEIILIKIDYNNLLI